MHAVADFGKLCRHVADLLGCLDRNEAALVHYAARRQRGEPIATSFVESAVDEIIAWRMVKLYGGALTCLRQEPCEEIMGKIPHS